MKKTLPLIALAALGLSVALTGCSKPAEDAASTTSSTTTTPAADGAASSTTTTTTPAPATK